MAKYTCYFKSKIYYNIYQNLAKVQQRSIQKPLKRLSKEVTSLTVTIFAKSSILDVWEGSEYAITH